MNKIEVRKFNNSLSIVNEKYPSEVACIGDKFFPNIGVEYQYLIWSDQAWINSFYADENNSIQEFTEEQAQSIEKICNEWVQPLGQEGNPTLEQAQEKAKLNIMVAFNSATSALTNKTTAHEMNSWNIQLAEANAYTQDEKAKTPFIDTLIEARNLGETKKDFVVKILANSDQYNIEYGKLLGKYQSLAKQINNASTVEEAQNITW